MWKQELDQLVEKYHEWIEENNDTDLKSKSKSKVRKKKKSVKC